MKTNLYIKANELLLDLFENILTNAAKYNENLNVYILIAFSNFRSKNEEFIKMEFKDNGIGIPDNRKELVFQRKSKRNKRIKGMGMGLSLVKEIVDRFNGQIWVEDNVKGDYKKGSNFVVLILKTEKP
ncbi:hypothetical protein LCGC14_2145240 [marine sediment metagenome]|uniref:Histidine kinase domain-containing protein n=1 Tax=marine sediment metagenome TaxID=412755 RepID=A0A0F9EJH1_9ZZZZ